MFVLAVFDWTPRAPKRRVRLVGVVEEPDLVGAAIGRLATRRQAEAIEEAREREARAAARRRAAGGGGEADDR